jgi:hypothetical protein
MTKYISINQCPIHKKYYSISVDDENGGFRLVGEKCCGRWVVIKQWAIDQRVIDEFNAEAKIVDD